MGNECFSCDAKQQVLLHVTEKFWPNQGVSEVLLQVLAHELPVRTQGDLVKGTLRTVH